MDKKVASKYQAYTIHNLYNQDTIYFHFLKTTLDKL